MPDLMAPISRRRYFVYLVAIVLLVVGLPSALIWAMRTAGCNSPTCDADVVVPAGFFVGWAIPLLGALAAGLLVFARGRRTGLGWWWAVFATLVLPNSLLFSPFGAMTILSLGLPPLINPSGQISAFGIIVLLGIPAAILPVLQLLVAGIVVRIPRDRAARVLEAAAIIAALYLLPSILFSLLGPLIPLEVSMTLEEALMAIYPDSFPMIPLAAIVIMVCLIYFAVRSQPRHTAA